MAIHSVDKSSDGRDNPKPNTHDTIEDTFRQAHGTNSVNYVTAPDSFSAQSAILGGNARLVASGTLTVENDGSTTTVASVPHSLGYTPLVIASLNNATITAVPEIVSIPLPTWASAAIAGGNVVFQIWLEAMASVDAVYVQMLNASGNPITITVTYYLYQQAAAG